MGISLGSMKERKEEDEDEEAFLPVGLLTGWRNRRRNNIFSLFFFILTPGGPHDKNTAALVSVLNPCDRSTQSDPTFGLRRTSNIRSVSHVVSLNQVSSE